MLRLLTLLTFAIFSGTASAYIGPGAGISVLGSLLGIIAGVFIALFAVIAWPVRRMLKKRKARQAEQAQQNDRPAVEQPADQTPES